ncbi:hypothetical protein [Micromonospora sp. NPDC049662]|uniref:hypothetical protein n=1 Tax=Micromonospora sp. NPDC049662 TaxID=3155397 RepID=UPI0034473EEC
MFHDGVPTVTIEQPDSSQEWAVVTARLDRVHDQARRIPDRHSADLYRGGAPTGVVTNPEAAFREVGPGLVVGSPAAAAAMIAVDNWTTSRPWWAGQALSVPGMIALETLERAGYLRSFPHHLTACSLVTPQLEALEEFNAVGIAAAADETRFASCPVAVTSAACHNVYAYLAGTRQSEAVRYTVKTTCARNEPSGFMVGRRMWSFTMREFVFVGPGDMAKAFADEAVDHLIETVRLSGLPAAVVRANDPFFIAQGAGPTIFQIAGDTKFEVVGLLPDGSELAIASVNLHRRHFSEAFDIQAADGSPAHTACVAFGLERWAYWLLSYLDDASLAPLAERLDTGTPLHGNGRGQAWRATTTGGCE